MTKKPVAPPDLTGISQQHLVCRDLAHAWKWESDIVPKRIDRKVVSIERMLSCLRCGTIRHDTYSVPDFQRVKSQYTYPEHYLVPNSGHVRVSFVREEIFKRWTKKGVK
jgi:hypothetical protein